MSKKFHIFYRDEMLYQLPANDLYHNFFLKPKLLLSKIVKNKLANHFVVRKKWEPFQAKDFYIAHTKEYVDSVFQGKELLCSTNGIPWNSHFVESVRYMNASLYYAVYYSIKNPEAVSICPTGGFVRATPERGSNFCTFSGQVITALKIMNSMGKKGAFIDLISYYSTSIPESKKHFFDNQVENAIPAEAHISPKGIHEDYIKDLRESLEVLEKSVLENKINYVVFTHGADSHEWDDLGSKCTSEEWIESSRMVYEKIKKWNQKRETPLPFIICLDGGFRSDDFSQIIDLHFTDLCLALKILGDIKVNFGLNIKENKIND